MLAVRISYTVLRLDEIHRMVEKQQQEDWEPVDETGLDPDEIAAVANQVSA